MIFMGVFWILLIVGVIYVIKWLATSNRSKDSFLSGGSRALEILQERYARAEIDQKEFEEKKQALEI
jgi:putative membrane protein